MPQLRPDIEVLYNTWSAYELLDSGNRRKLERFGDYVLVRSEPKAWWQPALSGAQWQRAYVARHGAHMEALTCAYREHQRTDAPVHEWPL